MQQINPLKFKPILKPTPWGGRKLKTLLNKDLHSNEPFGESWEIVDLPDNQSIVIHGEFQNKELQSLLKENPIQILGKSKLSDKRFPVLFKFIDARKNLSVQVHPDENAAKKNGNSARPKTESWYIIEAQPKAKLYLGLKQKTTQKDLEQAIKENQVEKLLNSVQVKQGDFIHIPAGLLHAIGEGIVLAEIQQVSNTTYRFYDWEKLGLDGKPRELHIKEALESIKYELSGIVPYDLPNSGNKGIRCKYFSFEEINLKQGQELKISSEYAQIITCIKGQCFINIDGNNINSLNIGETCLIPNINTHIIQTHTDSLFLLVTIY